MIYVLASIQIKEGKLTEFIEIFKANMPKVLEEKGCIEYAPAIDVPTGLSPQDLNTKRVTIIEKWDSLEDLKAHLSAPHMLSYREATKHLVTDLSIKVLKQL